VRVVDLTSVVMGPFGTHILADLGADVVKVEAPEGDSFRSYRPMRHAGMSGGFLHLNRNKRSLRLNLKRPEARAALDKVIARADVFVHSMRPDAIARLGYPYEAVRKIMPDIVYCGAHGFGTAGRYAGKAAYDDIIQAGSGLSALQAAMHGAPGYLPTVLCDKVAGQVIAYSIMAGLFQRASGGGGQAIEVPMFETLVEFNLVEHMMGAAFDPPLGPPVFNRVIRRKPACSAPHRPYFTLTKAQPLAAPCRNKYLTAAIGTPHGNQLIIFSELQGDNPCFADICKLRQSSFFNEPILSHHYNIFVFSKLFYRHN
jgi:crotonobetainyl-CoA:carnitine CoA-transferase CaiB-like acyl-CoA transferase